MFRNRFDSERPSAGVPRELPLDGLSLADLAQLGLGDFTMERKMIEPRWEGVVRHILTAVGAFMVAMGWADDAMAKEIIGTGMMLVSFLWSWMSK